MATITLNSSTNTPTLSESRIVSVSLEDYNKLKSKYEKKRKENKILRENLDSIMSSYETINQSKKTVESIFDSIKDLIKTNKSTHNKSKEEFSTSYSHYEFKGIADMKTAAKSFCNCSSSSTLNTNKECSSPNLLRKIEEIENAYNQILKNFNLLTAKYKAIKEEKTKLEDCNVTLIDQIAGLTEEYNRICNELSEANITIERFKEIDNCLVDSTINSLFLNTNEKRTSNANSNNPNSDNKNGENRANKVNNTSSSYILCEPVPSFIKFINKFTK